MSFAISNEEVQALFDKELQKANKNNSQFHSAHEGYAFLLEEVEEINDVWYRLLGFVDDIWTFNAKKNEKTTQHVEATKEFTIELIKEVIQLGAMCEKLLYFLSEDEKKEGDTD